MKKNKLKRCTLVLNAAYQVVNVVSLKKVGNYIANDKVEIIVESETDTYSSFGVKKPLPLVVRLKKYSRYYTNSKMKFAKRKIFARDHFTCCYCGEVIRVNKKCTVDHVIPISRGGQSTWENCVTACLKCNSFKANRTPEEAGLWMVYEPKKPKNFTDLLLFDCNIKEEWKPYLNMK